ncbi:stage II sporulation protein P [Acutalibacter sp. 1XD8-33]|uniref:stage II sporulation protein P n=1 Tax=Acutalibacter sp. 1XD8-33 TaxID=2320081 RepID=UPI001FA9BE41|nr:stage II sporulation protein P [Acutalibacter sp. 1XD8-33]
MEKLCRLGKNLVVLACAAVCIWCVAENFQSWAKEQGGKALLFAAGMGIQETPVPAAGMASDSPVTTAEPQKPQTVQPMELNLPDDGIVPFHSDLFPGQNATPDPDRANGPVEEIQMDGGTQIGNFYVRDSTESGTDLAAELLEQPDVDIKADGSVEVLIYHTHTSEAYSASSPGFYYTDMETRTQNQDMSVVAAGEELCKALQARGIGAVHDKTVNDGVYNGSYARSWEVIQKNLQEHPGIQVTIDLHRDSMTTESGVKYKPTAEVGGRKAAQAMLLAGCDADGSWGDFPDWRLNLRLMLRVQQKAQELYPGLMRPMNFSNSKYNMNATHGSMLIEVGTEVNTAAEARYTGQLLGEILAEALTTI